MNMHVYGHRQLCTYTEVKNWWLIRHADTVLTKVLITVRAPLHDQHIELTSQSCLRKHLGVTGGS